MADLEWSDFKVILALSRGGSVAAAGRILGVDSSTVSRRLAAAEDAFGAVLVLRGGREFLFTPEGNMALRTAEAMETSILSTTAAIKSAKQAIEGKVIITTVGMYHYLLRPVCDRLHEKYPGLWFELDDSDHKVNLANGDADIGLRFAEPIEPDLIARKVFDLGWRVFASKEYAAQYGLPKTFEDLRQHRLVLYNEAFHHIKVFAWLEQYKSTEGRFERVKQPTVAIKSVMTGAGLCGIPAYEAAQYPNLVDVFPETYCLQPAYLVYHESQRDSARIRVVMDELVAFLAGKKQELAGLA